MNPGSPSLFLNGDRLRVIVGNALDELRKLPDACVQCCVTSPPFYGLRDYGVPPTVWGGDADCAHEWAEQVYYTERSAGKACAEAFSEPGDANAQRIKESRWRKDSFCRKCQAWLGCYGLEPTPELFTAHTVLIFREVRRVLRNDGTLWLNFGDSYAGSWGNYSGQNRGNGSQREITTGSQAPNPAYDGREDYRPPATFKHAVLKPKDLIGIPWRVAFALQADGWYLRSDIIWSKPNPMPESVTDRPTKSHETIFLLTKSARYFYDAEAIKEPAAPQSLARISQPNFENQTGGPKDYGTIGVNPNRSMRKTLENFAQNPGRNKRSVWTVATQPYADAHFATYPPELIKPCILAGTSERGCCPQCGTPWVRILEKIPGTPESFNGSSFSHGKTADSRSPLSAVGTAERTLQTKTVGWKPGCACSATDASAMIPPIPCIVLDPFGGSGTTAKVALELGRRAVTIELNPEYAALIEQRTSVTLGLGI